MGGSHGGFQFHTSGGDQFGGMGGMGGMGGIDIGDILKMFG